VHVTIRDVTTKEGRSGPLVFVLVRHGIDRAVGDRRKTRHLSGTRRQQASVQSRRHAPVGATWTRTPARRRAVPLFGVAFNGHRIHYDRRYVTEVEGYPG
jgi:3-methylfumaryl-CoA hydratase